MNLICRAKRFLLLAAVVLPAISSGAAGADVHALKARQLIGMTVENEDGQTLGKLEDLVLDPQTGKVKFALVRSGGFFGICAKVKPVPPAAISAATTLRDTLAITVSKQRWADAPVFKSPQLAAFDEGQARQISKFYGEPAPAARAAANPMQNILHSTGKAATPSAQLKLASDFLGRRVVNRQKEKIGAVWDLLVDLSGKSPAFAIVSAGKFFRNRERKYAVALNALRPEDDSRKLAVDASRESLDQARAFDQRAWESGGAAGIYRYNEIENAATKPQSQARVEPRKFLRS